MGPSLTSRSTVIVDPRVQLDGLDPGGARGFRVTLPMLPSLAVQLVPPRSTRHAVAGNAAASRLVATSIEPAPSTAASHRRGADRDRTLRP
jgi:hypothetical protein